MKYANPIIRAGKGEPCAQPDPFAFSYGDRFYIVATNPEGVTLYESDDFANWRYRGFALQVSGQKEYWAPCVLEWGGKWYLYYSSMDEGDTDVHRQRIRVAVSDSPDKPFTYLQDLLPPFSIDPHAVVYRGERYLFYSINDYEAERAGTYIVLDKLLSPLKTEGKPIASVRPSLPEEMFQKDRFRKGQDWYTLEGACYFRDGDWHYLMYSGNCYEAETYFVGYARAFGSPDDLRELKFQKYPDENTYSPLLARNEFVEGTGHNSVISLDGKNYIVYHGRERRERKSYDTRSARVDELRAADGRLLVLGPTI